MLVKRYEFDNTKACLTFPLDCRDLTHKLEYVSPKTCNALYIYDWACKNWAYPHKLHMFRKWYFTWSVLMILMFCKVSILSY